MYHALGFAHASLYHHLDRARRSLPSEHGQGTVEYIGLILLIGAVMAVVTTSGHGKSIGDKVVGAIQKAIGDVSDAKAS